MRLPTDARAASCYLEANGFTCYIVSGGDGLMRPMTMANYGVPPER